MQWLMSVGKVLPRLSRSNADRCIAFHSTLCFHTAFGVVRSATGTWPKLLLWAQMVAARSRDRCGVSQVVCGFGWLGFRLESMACK